ncbi:MAG: SRPBCC domain-containing protein [Marinicaulis sp.]|nr:SRPBCC domain-containing protein [Marinicaulis sp.]
MSNNPLADITHDIFIDAPLDHAWKTLTDPDHVSQWFGCLQYTGKLGDVFYMQPNPELRGKGDIAGATYCEILKLDAPDHFVFSWYVPGTPKTEVSIRLQDVGEKRTKAMLVHSGWDQFPAEDVRHFWEQLANGWKSHVLPNLKAAAEAG